MCGKCAWIVYEVERSSGPGRAVVGAVAAVRVAAGVAWMAGGTQIAVVLIKNGEVDVEGNTAVVTTESVAVLLLLLM